jgi:hypothetical protein
LNSPTLFEKRQVLACRFSNEFCTTPGNLSTNRKKGIKIQKRTVHLLHMLLSPNHLRHGALYLLRKIRHFQHLSAIFGTFSHFQLFQPFSTIIKLTYLPTSPKSLAQVIHAFRKLSGHTVPLMTGNC